MYTSQREGSWMGGLPKELLEHLVAKALKRLNLVSREEFDVQMKVLQRSREKIDFLEKKLAKIEQP